MALRPKQAAFVREYLVDLNGTQAAIRAGYSPKTAEKIASENLRKPEVAKAIQEAMERRAERVEVKQDDILREYLRIATVDIGQAFDEHGRLKPLKDIPVDVRRAIAGIDVVELDGNVSGLVKKIRFVDKKGALDSLARHLGMFKDKVEVELGSAFADALKAARERALRR